MKRNKLHTYLAPYLETGNEAEIAAARKRYVRMYQASWIKEKRNKRKSFLIYLSDVEVQTMAKAARESKRSKTKFIKEAALAYVRQTFLVPDVLSVHEIKGLLVANHAVLLGLMEKNLLPYNVADMVASILVDLEDKVLASLEQPKQIGSDY